MSWPPLRKAPPRRPVLAPSKGQRRVAIDAVADHLVNGPPPRYERPRVEWEDDSALSDADLNATTEAFPFLAAVVDRVRVQRDTPPVPLESLHVYAARRWREYAGHPQREGQVSMQVAAHGRRLVEEARLAGSPPPSVR